MPMTPYHTLVGPNQHLFRLYRVACIGHIDRRIESAPSGQVRNRSISGSASPSIGQVLDFGQTDLSYASQNSTAHYSLQMGHARHPRWLSGVFVRHWDERRGSRSTSKGDRSTSVGRRTRGTVNASPSGVRPASAGTHRTPGVARRCGIDDPATRGVASTPERRDRDADGCMVREQRRDSAKAQPGPPPRRRVGREVRVPACRPMAGVAAKVATWSPIRARLPASRPVGRRDTSTRCSGASFARNRGQGGQEVAGWGGRT